MTTLALELSAGRLLGNVFGTSNLVWANVIGLMLLYLTIGYFIGGRWADRSPFHSTFYRILLWGAFLSALIPLVADPVLFVASRAVVGARAALAVGSFLAVLALFSIPVTLLGTASPFAIRLSVTTLEDAGAVAGRVYAFSTLGSLLGTFLPTLVTIPLLGTARTFLLFAAILFVVGWIGLFRQQGRKSLIWWWMPLLIGVLALVVLSGPMRGPISERFTVLYEDESAYNYIQVQQDDAGYRYLFLNEGQGIHSQWHPQQIIFQRTWSFFLTAPYFNNPSYGPEDVDSLAVIGLAAGTIPRQYIEVYGNIPIDGVEIDPEIIDVGQRYFGMNPTEMPSLTVYAQDGRYVLTQLEKTYSVIAIDAYRPPYIPWHLTTVEFFEEVRAHLQADGVVAINVGRTSTDRRLVEAMTATLSVVFPSVHTMDVPGTFNSILVATQQPTDASNLEANLAAIPEGTPLHATLALGVASLVPSVSSDLVFTDDYAPVELLVDTIVINFLLSGDLEQIR